jgi:signal transduction histidine kinase
MTVALLAIRPRLPRRTIRLRLTVTYGGLFLISGAGLLAITYVLVGNAAVGCLSAVGQHGLVNCMTGSPHGGQAGSEGSLQFTDGSGSRTLKPPPRQAQALASQAQALAASQHASEMHQLLIYSGLALAIMAVLSVALGSIVAGRVLRPLRTITTAARDISATSLHQRLALGGPGDELKELGDTFDDLLGRLESAFESQRQFVANASHELRTPLAWQRTLVQVALADPEADAVSLRTAHERVLASGAQQERLIEALLTLTRGQAGLEKREAFDLAPVARQVLRTRQSEARARGLDIHAALAPAPAAGDPRLAERLVTNLVDNALRHNAPDGHVEVVTGTRNSRAVLSVINTGPVVPAAAVDRLLKPFQRLGSDRTSHGEGLGLGLSIVQAIAQAHGAALAVLPQPGGGLKVEVSFQAGSSARGEHRHAADAAIPAEAAEDISVYSVHPS